MVLDCIQITVAFVLSLPSCTFLPQSEPHLEKRHHLLASIDLQWTIKVHANRNVEQ
mgnify:CR=1 FL=1